MKLINHLHLAPRLRTRGAILPLPKSLHGVYLIKHMACCLVKQRDNLAFTLPYLLLVRHELGTAPLYGYGNSAMFASRQEIGQTFNEP